tara:strand:+ start:1832 stop:2857 length:1026 start_codon:yes stop_codon:yes gene_type:complete
MIIKDYQLDHYIKSDNSEFIAFLVYGPNEGLIRNNITNIKKLFSQEKKCDEILINCKDLDKDKQLMADKLSSISMFNEKRFILTENIREKDFKYLKEAIFIKPDNTLLIVKTDNLSKSSKIRKLFEMEKFLLALACYEDDVKSIIRTIDNFAKVNSIALDRDIKSYLMQTLSTDRIISQNELEKIKLFYFNSNEKIDLNTIKTLLNDEGSKNIQKMNENILSGKADRSINIIKKLLMEGARPITLIRSLVNYLKRLKITKIQIKKGVTFDEAIKSLKPPVFWKDKDSFKFICNNWPLPEIEKCISLLLAAEINCIKNSETSEIMCEKFMMDITAKGRSYNK